MLNINDKAPNFKAKFISKDDIQELSLNDFVGKKIVLYFYPKDDTEGCTLEAIDFSKHLESFYNNNTVVFGVSRDSIKSHDSFIKKHCLQIPLICDEKDEIVTLYNVLKLKKMYGKEYLGIERTTFLIDENLQIQKIWTKVKVDGHAQEVLSEIALKK
jgi:peroxiredoxin Q/BCP